MKLSGTSEEKLLHLIRSGEFDKIVINFKDRKMHSFSLTKQQSTSRKFVDVLRENPFQEIIIKSHNGKICSFKNTVKIILRSANE